MLSVLYGRMGQFQRSQQQQVSISGQRVYKTSVDLGDAKLTYQNNNGQETLDVEVRPEFLQQIVERVQRGPVYPPIYEYELAGYIFMHVDHTTGELGSSGGEFIPTVPIPFSLSVNDQVVLSGEFTQERDSQWNAAALFGRNVLKYHSHRDDRNEVAQGKFIDYPSPKRKTHVDEYDEWNMPFSGDLPEYEIFNVPGGLLGVLDMTLWDGATTPLILDGTPPNQSRALGGGITHFDDITKSPMKPFDKNKISLDFSAPAGVTFQGYVIIEFFARSELRKVKKTWRFAAVDGQEAFLNDRAGYIFANFGNYNTLSVSPRLTVPYWWQVYSSVPGLAASGDMIIDTPNNHQDDAQFGRELILDLSR